MQPKVKVSGIPDLSMIVQPRRSGVTANVKGHVTLLLLLMVCCMFHSVRSEVKPTCQSDMEVNPYRAFRHKVTFKAARDACRDLGLSLATPRSRSDNDLIQQAAEAAGVHKFWLGLKVTRTAMWSDGSDVTWTKWGRGHKLRSCIRQRKFRGWKVVACRSRHHYICQQTQRSVDKCREEKLRWVFKENTEGGTTIPAQHMKYWLKAVYRQALEKIHVQEEHVNSVVADMAGRDADVITEDQFVEKLMYEDNLRDQFLKTF